VDSEPRTPPTDPLGPSAEFATYTSQAYASTNDEAATQAVSAWLEEQSLHPFIREVAARSLERLALVAGEAVLEVGCGTGVFLPGLATLVGPAGRVVGLDHAPAFLAQSRERLATADLAGRVELVEADAQHLPFDDATFDAAHCERVLMHVEDPAGAIREMQRVVRPGGRLVVAEVFAAGATLEHPDAEATRQINEVMVSGIRNGSMGIQLRGLFVEAGLTDVDGDVVGLFETELDQEEFDEFGRIARDLASRGLLDPARAEAAVATLEDRRVRGTYCGLALMFVVSGRVAEGARDA
jgi:SAM-dependent methyltransferase